MICLQCEICGTLFEVPIKKHHKYCQECALLRTRHHTADWKARHPNAWKKHMRDFKERHK